MKVVKIKEFKEMSVTDNNIQNPSLFLHIYIITENDITVGMGMDLDKLYLLLLLKDINNPISRPRKIVDTVIEYNSITFIEEGKQILFQRNKSLYSYESNEGIDSNWDMVLDMLTSNISYLTENILLNRGNYFTIQKILTDHLSKYIIDNDNQLHEYIHHLIFRISFNHEICNNVLKELRSGYSTIKLITMLLGYENYYIYSNIPISNIKTYKSIPYKIKSALEDSNLITIKDYIEFIQRKDVKNMYGIGPKHAEKIYSMMSPFINIL